jgi:hypothetical protein
MGINTHIPWFGSRNDSNNFWFFLIFWKWGITFPFHLIFQKFTSEFTLPSTRSLLTFGCNFLDNRSCYAGASRSNDFSSHRNAGTQGIFAFLARVLCWLWEYIFDKKLSYITGEIDCSSDSCIRRVGGTLSAPSTTVKWSCQSTCFKTESILMDQSKPVLTIGTDQCFGES